MNNSIYIEEPEPVVEKKAEELLRTKEGDLVKVIEALGSLSNNRDWSTLKTYVFNGLVEKLENELLAESKRLPLRPEHIYYLQGQLTWAKKYSNLESFAEVKRLELTNVRQHLPTDVAVTATDNL